MRRKIYKWPDQLVNLTGQPIKFCTAALDFVDTLYILNTMTTKIRKWGNSLAVRIPDEFAENLDLRDGSVVGFQQSGGKIIITRAKPVYTIEDMVKGITKKNRHKLLWPNDKPRGKEIW